MSGVDEKTRKEYSLLVEFSDGTINNLNINLAFDDTKPTYELPYIDKVLHHIPSSLFMLKLICNVNDLDYNHCHIMNVYIVNTRHPDKKVPILYSNLPLPLNVADAFAALNHYRALELFDQDAHFNEVAKKKREMFERLKVENEQDLEFVNRKFIDEVVRSYRLRRTMTLTLFDSGMYNYKQPEDLLPPSPEDPNQMRMF